MLDRHPKQFCRSRRYEKSRLASLEGFHVPQQIGKLIRSIREEMGLTQRNFAELINMNFTYLSRLENDRLGTVPSAETLKTMADVLDIDRDWLLTQCGRPPEGMEQRIARNPELFEQVGKLEDRQLKKALNRKPHQLVGQIPAGQPVEAIEDTEAFDLTEEFSPEDHFLLRVKGDSMIDDAIHDGDIAIIRSQSTCENGDVVAAIVDGEEATLKRFLNQGKRIKLQPSNEAMEPIVVAADRVEVRGKLVGLIRTRF
jgi:SOS-response transcriptional repressor LexA